MNPCVIEYPELVGAHEKRVFEETINEAVHHALINQSGVLINTLTKLIKQVAARFVHQ
jgi:hypothetical protein